MSDAPETTTLATTSQDDRQPSRDNVLYWMACDMYEQSPPLVQRNREGSDLNWKGINPDQQDAWIECARVALERLEDKLGREVVS